MAAVFEFRPDTDRYRGLAPVARVATERLLSLGERRAEGWRAPELRWMGAHAPSDFPYLVGHVPVVSDRAFEVLAPLIGARTDKLPVRVAGGGYTALHVRDFPDCLDVEASKIEWFEPGRAMMIEDYVFRRDRLEGHHLFRLKIRENGIAFLSGEAMEAIKAAGLTGLVDALLWEG